MKPCLKYREQIATMAINALEIRSELRAHLGSCADCRSYLEEISNVAGSLRAGMPQSDAQPSPSFHRNVVTAVEVAKRCSTVEAVSEQLRSLWNWRFFIPAAATAVMVVAAWPILVPHAGVPSPIHHATRVVSIPEPKADLEPTFLNYEMAANQSFDKLDELLTEQGNRNQPSSPISAAAPFSRSNFAD